ncbi:MAG: DUF885 family protein, partial [Chloroflexota bacterium]
MGETPFVELVRSFVYDRFAQDPVAATIAGVHDHDHELGDMTARGFGLRRERSERALAEFSSIDEPLSSAQQVDRDLVLAQLRGERALFAFERWRRDPGMYADLITRSAYYALVREHAPLEQRLAVLAERLAQAPAVLDAGRLNLASALVPPEWVAIALRTVPAGARFLREQLPAAVPDTALGRAVRSTLVSAAAAAADALDRYAAWLGSDLAPVATGSFAIGRDAFEALLKERELLEYDAPALRAFGEDLVRETEADLAAAAKGLGDDDWRDSVLRFKQDHPGADELVATYRAEMERSREAVRLAQLATIPYGEDLVVEVRRRLALHRHRRVGKPVS